MLKFTIFLCKIYEKVVREKKIEKSNLPKLAILCFDIASSQSFQLLSCIKLALNTVTFNIESRAYTMVCMVYS